MSPTTPPASGESEGLSYAAAGVDIAAGERAVERIRKLVAETATPGVLGGLGGFAGMFSLSDAGSMPSEPVLLASTDGVGTKLAVAAALGRYDSVGMDLVAMCVDDLACSGARPLFFLDYIVMERLDVDVVEALVAGIAQGCKKAGAALLGGEMAEHPGTMTKGELDLAGFAVGMAERSALWGPDKVRPGDLLVGLPSPGLRSNGYSLARHALLEVGGRSLSEPAWHGAETTLGEELLRPSVIYSPTVVALSERGSVHAAAHITGGGIAANLARALPGDCDAVLWRDAWTVPRIFAEVQSAGSISAAEMAKVFNLGLGMVLVVAEDAADGIVEGAAELGARVVGEVRPGSGVVAPIED